MRELVKVRQYAVGYQIRYERISGDEAGGDESFIMRSAYTPEGHYIGSSRQAHQLIVTRGIRPEPRTPTSNVCSIGFCEREQKWYGWSHRAMRGFGIGDTVAEGDLTATSGWTDEYLKTHPEADLSLPIGFVAETLEDAKRMAVALADAIS